MNKCLSCDRPHHDDVKWIIYNEEFCYKCAIKLVALFASYGEYPPSMKQHKRDARGYRKELGVISGEFCGYHNGVSYYNNGSYIVHDMGQ